MASSPTYLFFCCAWSLLIAAETQLLMDSSGVYPVQSEQVVYTSNSVQIQACASIPNVASYDRAAFQSTLSQTIGALIATSTLFLTRVYSGSTGDVCFFFVYQAANQEAAQAAFFKLSPQGIGTAKGFSLTVTFNSLPYVCTVSTSVWQNEDSAPFGVQLPFQWTSSDILLWALGGGALLSVAAISACCCILHFSARRETAILESIVALDQQMLAKMQRHYQGTPKLNGEAKTKTKGSMSKNIKKLPSKNTSVDETHTGKPNSTEVQENEA